MFRKDIAYMMENDWEPKIPSKKNILKQVRTKEGKINGKFSGSVRLGLGLVKTQK